MKQLRTCIYAFLILGATLASCGKKSADQLVKTWQVTEIKTKVKVPDKVKESMMANATMLFTKDGHYTTTGGIGADEGTYTLDKDGKTLSTVSAAGKSNEVYAVDELSDDKLKLTNQGNTVTCTAVKQ